MLLLHVPVRDVHVLQCGVVVLVSVGGEQMSPVLSLMQVVRDVIVLVAMLQGLMLMMSLLPRHARSPLSPPPRPIRSTVHRAMGRHKQRPSGGMTAATRSPVDHLHSPGHRQGYVSAAGAAQPE